MKGYYSRMPRENDKPKVCPGCKSAYWNNPIRQKFNAKEKKRLR
jgi:hypothetical protein